MHVGQHIANLMKAMIIACAFIVNMGQSWAESLPSNDEVIAVVEAVLTPPSISNSDYQAFYSEDEKIIHQLLLLNFDVALSMVEKHKGQLKYESLYDAFFDIKKNSALAIEKQMALKTLQTALETEVWEDQHIANLLIALAYSQKLDVFQILEYAHNSLSVIPDKTDQNVQNARFNSYYLLHYAYTVDRSPKAVFNAVKKLVEINGLDPFPFGKFSTIYNLSGSFHQAGEYSTSLEISKLLLDSPEVLTDYDKALAHLSYIQNLMNLDRHQEAINSVDKAFKLAPNKSFEIYMRALLIESLVQNGEFTRAEAEIDLIEKEANLSTGRQSRSREYVAKSKAVLAANNKDFKQAYRRYKNYANKKIKELNQAISNDRRELHQRVLLSQELSEKELEKTSLQRALDKAKIERQRTLNNVYLLLMSLGLIAIIAALLFMRKLGLLNHKLFLANEQVKEKAKVKSELMAMFSHEMLTPLNGIVPLADVLRQSESDRNKQNLLKTIELNGAELTRKIREIIMVANPDEQINNPSEINIKSFLENSQKQHSQDLPDGVKFNVKMERGMPRALYLDAERLETIADALLSNSKKYTKAGEIRMSLYRDPTGRPVLEITDTGHGMPSHHVKEMIKPFGQASLSITRANQGLGLGLTVVRLHCAIMGAEFNVHSQEGVGTVTHIILPLACLEAQDIRPERAA